MMQDPQAINSVIDHLAAKLSVPAAHLWAVLVAQVRVSIIQNIVAALVFLAIAAIAWSKRRSVRAWSETPDGDLAALWFYYVGCAVPFVVCLAIVGGVMGRLMNPEYYVLNDLLDSLRGK